MKKIMILAVAAIALAACSRTFETHEVAQAEIGFGTWAETMTKAEARVQGTNTFLAGDTFAVYGYKDKSDNSDPKTVFDDDVVTASGTGTLTWDYSNHRFWDTNYDKYIFYGVSPSAFGTGGTVDPQTGEISTDVTFGGDDSDILIANKTIVQKGTNSFNNFGTVEMVFNHAATLVDVIVKKAPSLDNAVVKTTAFEFENIQSAGTLEVSAYGASDPYKPTIALANWTWDASSTDTYDTGDCVGTITLPVLAATDADFPGADNTDVPAGDVDDYNKVIDNLVVMPQTFLTTGTRQLIKMTYTITTTDGSSNTSTNTYADQILYLSDFDDVDNKAQDDDKIASWQPGKHYIFYITIDANEIKFSASINDWDSTIINGYHYLIN